MRYANNVPVRVDIDEYNEAERLKDGYIRTIQGQISYWAKIGRYALANPTLTGNEVEKLVVDASLNKKCIL